VSDTEFILLQNSHYTV